MCTRARVCVCVSTSCLFAITFKEGKKRSKEKKDTVLPRKKKKKKRGKLAVKIDEYRV